VRGLAVNTNLTTQLFVPRRAVLQSVSKIGVLHVLYLGEQWSEPYQQQNHINSGKAPDMMGCAAMHLLYCSTSH
jgi:hypothetical protein